MADIHLRSDVLSKITKVLISRHISEYEFDQGTQLFGPC